MSATHRIRRIAARVRPSHVTRAVGLGLLFLFTAAPLPGDIPSCNGEGGQYLDNSPRLDDLGISAMCIERCEADCIDLQACGMKPDGDAELRLCKTECSTQRQCAALTEARLCPDTPDAEVTMNERNECTGAPRDPRPPVCWCENSADCWSPLGVFPGDGDPWGCRRSELCDPRE